MASRKKHASKTKLLWVGAVCDPRRQGVDARNTAIGPGSIHLVVAVDAVSDSVLVTVVPGAGF